MQDGQLLAVEQVLFLDLTCSRDAGRHPRSISPSWQVPGVELCGVGGSPALGEESLEWSTWGGSRLLSKDGDGESTLRKGGALRSGRNGGEGETGSRAERPPQGRESPLILFRGPEGAFSLQPQPGVSSLPHSPAQEAEEKVGMGWGLAASFLSLHLWKGCLLGPKVPVRPPLSPGHSWLFFFFAMKPGVRGGPTGSCGTVLIHTLRLLPLQPRPHPQGSCISAFHKY